MAADSTTPPASVAGYLLRRVPVPITDTPVGHRRLAVSVCVSALFGVRLAGQPKRLRRFHLRAGTWREHSGHCWCGTYQLQSVRMVIRPEQAMTGAKHERVDHQEQLVD